MDSAWASTHRKKITLLMGSAVTIALLVYIGVAMYEPPTCGDGKTNQGESSVDCGGPCARLCEAQVSPLRTAWVRLFAVSPGWWSAMAYVENPNFGATATDVPFRMAVYDSDGKEIAARSGTAFCSGEPVIPVFVGRINAGEGTPSRAEFTWLNKPFWVRKEGQYELSIAGQRLVTGAHIQELNATLKNGDPVPHTNVHIVAIVYDLQGNAMAASETRVDHVPVRGEKQIVFTWPEPFPGPPGRVEIIPRIRL